MTETTPGREVVQVVELKQPFCAHVYGSSPCTASGTADQKCYNTRRTCKDTANFALGTPLSLFFSRGNVADRGVEGAPYIIPSLKSVSTVPARINLAGGDSTSQPIGKRASCTFTFTDHPHTDAKVDPYGAGRSWNPLDADRGSFWTRWLARNPYRQNVEMTVYDGYAGQALADMTSRTYFLQSAQHSGASGTLSIKGQDILTRVEERKAQAPLASPGVLQTDITDSTTSFEATGATSASYAETGTLRIGDEVMTYTGRSDTTNGVTFTGVTRATDDTTASSHSAEDGVQQCLRFDDTFIDTALQTLLEDYAGVSTDWMDLAGWAAERDDYLSFFLLNGVVSEPTGVMELISSILLQTMTYAWWDERTSLIKIKAVRGIDAEPDLLTEENHIIADSFSIEERPVDRASQAWVYYGKRSAVATDKQPASFKAAEIFANLESETEEFYGEASIRKVWGNFLSTAATAGTVGSKIVTRFADTPKVCTFQLDAKDRDYWLGDQVRISHHLDVDDFGQRQIRTWTIVQAEEIVSGEIVKYEAEDTTLYGLISYIMADDAVDYPGPELAPFQSGYIGDNDGLLSDGSNCARIN